MPSMTRASRGTLRTMWLISGGVSSSDRWPPVSVARAPGAGCGSVARVADGGGVRPGLGLAQDGVGGGQGGAGVAAGDRAHAGTGPQPGGLAADDDRPAKRLA